MTGLTNGAQYTAVLSASTSYGTSSTVQGTINPASVTGSASDIAAAADYESSISRIEAGLDASTSAAAAHYTDGASFSSYLATNQGGLVSGRSSQAQDPNVLALITSETRTLANVVVAPDGANQVDVYATLSSSATETDKAGGGSTPAADVMTGLPDMFVFTTGSGGVPTALTLVSGADDELASTADAAATSFGGAIGLSTTAEAAPDVPPSGASYDSYGFVAPGVTQSAPTCTQCKKVNLSGVAQWAIANYQSVNSQFKNPFGSSCTWFASEAVQRGGGARQAKPAHLKSGAYANDKYWYYVGVLNRPKSPEKWSTSYSVATDFVTHWLHDEPGYEVKNVANIHKGDVIAWFDPALGRYVHSDVVGDVAWDEDPNAPHTTSDVVLFQRTNDEYLTMAQAQTRLDANAGARSPGDHVQASIVVPYAYKTK